MTKISTSHRREDETQCDGNADLVLELAAPLDVDAFGEWHLLGDDDDTSTKPAMSRPRTLSET